MPYADPQAKRQNASNYYLANREAIKARAERWRRANPERASQRVADWKAANAGRSAQLSRESYERNREVVLQRTRERERRLIVESPEQLRAGQRDRQARRRARQRNQHVEAVNPLVVWDRDSGICGICGELADKDDWHLDHIVPISRGGEHSYANVQVSHPICNRRKAAS